MKKTIICVDDERIILDSLKYQLLKHFGNEVTVELVESGSETLDLLEELEQESCEIPLIISDHLMPGMNGDELLIEVHKRHPQMNKILLTGRTEDKSLFSLINKINLYRYIPKPWEEADLQLTVSEALNAYQRELDLAEKNRQLSMLNVSLEVKVKERTNQLAEKTDQLEHIVNDLKIAQNQLVESEKLASLGQLMAGIAHEINTPLGAINASVGSLKESFWGAFEELSEVLRTFSGPEAELYYNLVHQAVNHKKVLSTREARAKRREIKEILTEWGGIEAQSWADKLVDMNLIEGLEKYRELILHDKNELILSSAFHLTNQTKTANNIETAVKKASKVVHALKSYSRFDQAEAKVEADLRENIETVLILYQNQIKQGVELIKNFNDDKIIIDCYPDELIQVWTNLIHNSIQAMRNDGKLTIDLHKNGKKVMVSISDNGPGIPEAIQPRVFDAFFTTKPTGEGSGLGLDIVRKIIDKHQGTIDFNSCSNGTTFNITLPK